MGKKDFNSVVWRSGLAGLAFAGLSVSLSFLSACGGASASCSAPTVLMGGTIQGNTLTLIPNVTTYAGSGSAGSNDGTGTAATFNAPWGVTTDGTNLYVADTVSHLIRKIVIDTGVVTTLAGGGGVGPGTSGAADGTGTNASFATPTGLTTDGTNLYVTDTGNSLIRKIVISTGVVTTLAGGGGVGPGTSGAADGTGTNASFNTPVGLTTDGTNLYVADFGNHEIRQIVIGTGVVTTLAGGGGVGPGTSGAADGTGTNASFNGPLDTTTDGTNLYVADSNNTAIRKIVIGTGAVSTLATGLGDPTGITTDGTNLYVTNLTGWVVRKVVIGSAVVTTLAGSGNGFIDGTGTAAQFRSPAGITTDGTNLYMADYNNNAVRMIY